MFANLVQFHKELSKLAPIIKQLCEDEHYFDLIHKKEFDLIDEKEFDLEFIA